MLKVKLDQRELKNKEILPTLRQWCDVEVAELTLGDLVTDHCIIERKEFNDYISSLVEGRLFDQMNRIFDTGKPAFLIVHGEVVKKRITDAQLYGSMAAIAVENGVSILVIPSLYDALYCAIKVLEKVEQGKHLKPRRVYERRQKKVPYCVDKMAKLFQISHKVSADLLRKYGSLKSMTSASMEELQQIDGIGYVRALHIHTILHKDWRKK